MDKLDSAVKKLGEHFKITENISNNFHTLFYSVLLPIFPCLVLVSINILNRGLVVLSADSTTSKYKDYINDIHRIS